jgi:hypothetical protein
MFKMHFYVTITKDGLYHVQNTVMGMMGQHHVHTKEGYRKWKIGIEKEYLHISNGKCCDMKDGEVKEGR